MLLLLRSGTAGLEVVALACPQGPFCCPSVWFCCSSLSLHCSCPSSCSCLNLTRSWRCPRRFQQVPGRSVSSMIAWPDSSPNLAMTSLAVGHLRTRRLFLLFCIRQLMNSWIFFHRPSHSSHASKKTEFVSVPELIHARHPALIQGPLLMHSSTAGLLQSSSRRPDEGVKRSLIDQTLDRPATDYSYHHCQVTAFRIGAHSANLRWCFGAWAVSGIAYYASIHTCMKAQTFAHWKLGAKLRSDR